ncbi:MAG: NRDE family protein [Xanthomonadales bacterium]
MCLILFAWQTHPRYALVVAANRDEFHSRPTAAADYWKESPQLLAGRDLQAGGTWLGITRQGRFAAITNYREPQKKEPLREQSRGHLVRDFLLDKTRPADYAGKLRQQGDKYRGFSVLLGDLGTLVYVSNRSEKTVVVNAGSHGLSNHLLDADWPKVHQGRVRLDALLEDEQVDPEALLELLADRSVVPGDEPPGLELHLAPELITRMMFIVSPEYGTRSSTVLLMDRDGAVTFVERQFDAAGVTSGTRSHEFRITQELD